MPFTCGDPGRTWPGVAWCLALLAPSLAPRNSLAALTFDGSNRSPTDRPQAQNGLFTNAHYWYGRARLVLTHERHPAPKPQPGSELPSTIRRDLCGRPAGQAGAERRFPRAGPCRRDSTRPQVHIPSEPVLTRRPAPKMAPGASLPRWTGSTPSAWRADPTLLAMTGRSDAHMTGTACIPYDSSRSDRRITERRVVDPRPATGLRLDRLAAAAHLMLFRRGGGRRPLQRFQERIPVSPPHSCVSRPRVSDGGFTGRQPGRARSPGCTGSQRRRCVR
jgi:hypothetical protein